MMRSMTAYGRGEVAGRQSRFCVEMRSVNRKHLDIIVNIPKELLRFEIDIKKRIGKVVYRGSVAVFVSSKYEDESLVRVNPNIPLVRQLKSAWDEIAQEWGYEGQIDPTVLAMKESIMVYSEDIGDGEEYRRPLMDSLDIALEGLRGMKDSEGVALDTDIRNRLGLLETLINGIEQRAQGSSEKYRRKLMERLEEVLPGVVENEERILREVAVYAERIDIAEEITRFYSSINQFYGIIDGAERCIGKTLDFLTQELQRETNTIASKSGDVEVSRLVVEIKSELERIREQLQNVE